MYEKIVAEDPYKTPMMIYPASHYAMGGLWVDYNLMSTIPGLFVLGEANFSDHGANRLGASALMQGLADGYFVIPNTINGYLAGTKFSEVTDSHEAFQESEAAGGRPGQTAAQHQGQSARCRTSTGNWAISCGSIAAWAGPTRASPRPGSSWPR